MRWFFSPQNARISGPLTAEQGLRRKLIQVIIGTADWSGDPGESFEGSPLKQDAHTPLVKPPPQPTPGIGQGSLKNTCCRLVPPKYRETTYRAMFRWKDPWSTHIPSRVAGSSGLCVPVTGAVEISCAVRPALDPRNPGNITGVDLGYIFPILPVTQSEANNKIYIL